MTTPIQTTIPAVLPEQDDRLHAIMNLATDMVATENQIAELETQLKLKKDHHKLVSESHLPQLMQEVGLTQLHMVGGRVIKIRPEYYGSVAQTRMETAVAWLKLNRMDGIVTREYKVQWDEEPTEAELITATQLLGSPITKKETINSQRLKAFVRERIEANDLTFPKELFAASQVNRAVLIDGN